MFNFSISNWTAWAPGIETREKWREWAQRPAFSAIDDAPLPDLSFLPAMQRRRLSPLARICVACAWPLAEGMAPMPVVYASHHGETGRSFELLQTLAADESLSPTAFSLSVHNAIAGLWSILRGETVESVALSAEGDGLEAAITEACMLLHSGHDAVLVVLAEAMPPQAYKPWIEDVCVPYVVALRVEPGRDFHLSLESPALPAPEAEDASLPAPLSLIRHVLRDSRQWRHAHAPRQWRWQRAPFGDMQAA